MLKCYDSVTDGSVSRWSPRLVSTPRCRETHHVKECRGPLLYLLLGNACCGVDSEIELKRRGP